MGLPVSEKAFSLFVDGVGMGGKVNKLQLPKLKRKTEELLVGTLDAPIEIDLGAEKMELVVTMKEYNEKILDTLSNATVGGVAITIRGSLKAEDSKDEVPAVWNFRGRWTEVDMGTLEPQKVGEKTYTMVLTYYKFTLNKIEKLELDTLNDIHKVNGVDLKAQRHKNLGV